MNLPQNISQFKLIHFDAVIGNDIEIISNYSSIFNESSMKWPVEVILKKVAYGVILGLISLLAVVGNLFVIIAMKNEKHLRTVNFIY